MPKANTSHALARQWELLKLLPPKGPGITAKDLAERLARAGFEVSKRTIERDLQDLSLIFPVMCNEKGIPYGWHWMPGASTDLPAITLSDALSLHVVEDFVRPLLPASVLEALARISHRWPRKGRISWHNMCSISMLCASTRTAL